jgi:hypothetical protein
MNAMEPQCAVKVEVLVSVAEVGTDFQRFRLGDKLFDGPSLHSTVYVIPPVRSCLKPVLDVMTIEKECEDVIQGVVKTANRSYAPE